MITRRVGGRLYQGDDRGAAGDALGIEDRNADVWEALLATAEAAGQHWPKRASVAAVALVAAAADKEPSLGIRLLSDLRDIFGECDQMTTAEILIHSMPCRKRPGMT